MRWQKSETSALLDLVAIEYSPFKHGDAHDLRPESHSIIRFLIYPEISKRDYLVSPQDALYTIIIIDTPVVYKEK